MAMTKYAGNKVRKILVVADCKDDKNLFKAGLTDMGYKVGSNSAINKIPFVFYSAIFIFV